MTVGEARAEIRRGAAATGGAPPLPMARVRELRDPRRGRPIPARFYVPPGLAPGEPAPLLVFFHGGGWVIGDLETHDGVCRFLAASAGVAVLAVDYRLAPEHPFPAAVEDAWAAFAWAVEQRGRAGRRPGPDRGRRRQRRRQPRRRASACWPAPAAAPTPAMQLLIYPVDRRRRQDRARGGSSPRASC